MCDCYVGEPKAMQDKFWLQVNWDLIKITLYEMFYQTTSPNIMYYKLFGCVHSDQFIYQSPVKILTTRYFIFSMCLYTG